MKIHNFSAGPSILPQEVFEKSSQAVLDFQGKGVSILEMSHRSAAFEEVMAEARNLVKKLLNAPSSYEVLFLQGGASLGFHMIPMNYLKSDGYASYVNTGTWASKAIQEAAIVGSTRVIASSEQDKFTYVPKNYTIPEDTDYLHITSNNTIYGTQLHGFPASPVPLICDMSSDIFSRPIQVADFSMIYAGAQKNMGPAGATMYLFDPNLLGKSGRKLPSMLDFQVHLKGDSMYNTPPVFSIYVSYLTMQWIEKMGGVSAMEKSNVQKAKLLYDEIDRNSLFYGSMAKEDRSYMNATFLLKNPELEKSFDEAWYAAGIREIKGHRSVGGYRASMYNALPIESVQVLVDVMKTFEQKFA